MTWNIFDITGNNVFSCLNYQLRKLDKKYPKLMPQLKQSRRLMAASDYSGEARGSNFMIFSFLLVSYESWRKWEELRIQIRSTYFADRRRMSFKRLGDSQRQEALLPFLNAANLLEGISFSVAVHRRFAGIFDDPPMDFTISAFAKYCSWKPPVLRKSLFAAHVLSLLVGGLGTPRQDLIWFTDEDAIAANDQRLGELVNLFVWISDQYLRFNMGHFRCATSKSDNGTRQLEDFLAIPDLIAGSLAQSLSLSIDVDQRFGDVFWLFRPDMPPKVATIINWLFDTNCSLRKLVAIIEPSEGASEQVVSIHHFLNKND